MANTQNASFQMLVLPDRHHFYTALAFHISSYIFHISSISDTRQTCLSPPFPSFFSLVYLFIYLFPPFSSSSYNPFFPFPFLFFTSHFFSFDPRYLFYRIISKGWRKVFYFFFFFFFFKFIPHLYIFIRSGKLMFPLNTTSSSSLSFSPALSLSLSRGELLIVAKRHEI